MDTNVLLENLSAKLGNMLKNADDFNTIIRIGQDPNVQTFYAHSNILRALSPYFNKALSKDWVKKENEIYIYTGTYNLDEKDPQEIIDILIASDEFMLSEFISSIELYLIEKRSDWLRSNIESYSVDDFTALGKVIIKFLPYIRFDHIYPNDFKEKVVPYKSLISIDIYEDILWKYISDSNFKLSPSSQRRFGSLDSKIIKKKQAALIASWVDQNDDTYTYNTMPYKFVLEIRGTRDGFSYETFKSKGDNKYNTIIVARVKDSKEVIGGYNPYYWKHDRTSSVDFWRPETRNFIFSFPNGETTDNANLSRINPCYAKYAMYIRKIGGPEFGNQDFYMSDQFDSKTGVRCKKTYYSKKIRDSEDSFAVD
ncbi:42681_t:CDS:2, partial [Gigaspora margarita]